MHHLLKSNVLFESEVICIFFNGILSFVRCGINFDQKFEKHLWFFTFIQYFHYFIYLLIGRFIGKNNQLANLTPWEFKVTRTGKLKFSTGRVPDDAYTAWNDEVLPTGTLCFMADIAFKNAFYVWLPKFWQLKLVLITEKKSEWLKYIKLLK